MMLTGGVEEPDPPSSTGISYQTSKLSSSSTSSKQSSTSSHKLAPSLVAFPSFLTSYEQNRLRMVKETYRYLESYQRDHSLSAYDRLTSMAARVFKTPLAMINFVFADEIRNISNFQVTQRSSSTPLPNAAAGADTPNRIPRINSQIATLQKHPFTMLRDHTYCHAVVEEHGGDIVVIPDTLSEKCQAQPELQPFAEFPVIRFYAAVPIMLGVYRIGTFCVLDPHPRYDFGDRDMQMLSEMGGIVSDMLLELTKVSVIESSECVDSAKVIVSLFSHIQSPLHAAQRVTNTIHEYIQDLNTIQNAKFDDKVLAGDHQTHSSSSSSANAGQDINAAEATTVENNDVVHFDEEALSDSDRTRQLAAETTATTATATATQPKVASKRRRRSSAWNRYQQTSAQLVSAVFALQHEILGLYQVIEHSIQLSISLLQGQQYDVHEIDFRKDFSALMYDFVGDIRKMSQQSAAALTDKDRDVFDDHFAISCFDENSNQLMTAGMERRDMVLEDIEGLQPGARGSSKDSASLINMNSSILWIILYSLLRTSPADQRPNKVSKLQCRLHRKPLHKATGRTSHADVMMRFNHCAAQNAYVSLIFEFALPGNVPTSSEHLFQQEDRHQEPAGLQAITSLIKMYGGRFHQWMEGRHVFVDIDIPCRIGQVDVLSAMGGAPNAFLPSGPALYCTSSETVNSIYRVVSNDVEQHLATPTNRSRRASSSTPKFSMGSIRSPMTSNSNVNLMGMDIRGKAVSPRIHTDRRNSNSTQNTVISTGLSMHALQQHPTENLGIDESSSPIAAPPANRCNDLDLASELQVKAKPKIKVSVLSWIVNRFFVNKQCQQVEFNHQISQKNKSKKQQKTTASRLNRTAQSVSTLSWWSKLRFTKQSSRVLPLDGSVQLQQQQPAASSPVRINPRESADTSILLMASSDDDRTVTGHQLSPRRQQPYLVPDRATPPAQQQCCISPRRFAAALDHSLLGRGPTFQSPEHTRRLE